MNGKKKLIIGLSVAVIAVIAVVMVIFFLKGEDSYRIIKIYEVDGTALVTRDGIGDIEPYNNMVLESGDKIVLDKGKMTLRLDEDKYVYVEEETEFTLVAEGTAEDSKTTIELEKGAITNEIQNKLSDESSYEVNTPNSTMAVRGTIFRVEMYEDENHVQYTKVSAFDGKVDSRLVYEDGTVAEKEVPIDKGKEVIIFEDEKTTDYLGETRDIDYSELPEDVIDLLISLTDDDATLEKLNELKEPSGPFTVTFIYNGTVFGTQTVEKGDCAQRPTLMPAASGNWDFDFSTPIKQDTEIVWK